METNNLQPREIPWSEAQEFAEKHNQDMIVVFTYSSMDKCEHVLTWGKTQEQSALAAHCGEKLKLAIGWPHEDLETVSAKTKKLIDSKNILLAACIEARLGLVDLFHKDVRRDEYIANILKILNNAVEKAETEVSNA